MKSVRGPIFGDTKTGLMYKLLRKDLSGVRSMPYMATEKAVHIQLTAPIWGQVWYFVEGEISR